MQEDIMEIVKISWMLSLVMFMFSGACIGIAIEKSRQASRYLEGWTKSEEDARVFRGWIVSASVKNGAVYSKEPNNVIRVEFK